MTPRQLKIASLFALGTLVFGAAHQGAISQGTALLALLLLTAVIRFGLLNSAD